MIEKIQQKVTARQSRNHKSALYRHIGVSACNQFVLNGFGGAVLNFLAKLREVGCQQCKEVERKFIKAFYLLCDLLFDFSGRERRRSYTNELRWR
jgi:hypothetical protein